MLTDRQTDTATHGDEYSILAVYTASIIKIWQNCGENIIILEVAIIQVNC